MISISGLSLLIENAFLFFNLLDLLQSLSQQPLPLHFISFLKTYSNISLNKLILFDECQKLLFLYFWFNINIIYKKLQLHFIVLASILNLLFLIALMQQLDQNQIYLYVYNRILQFQIQIEIEIFLSKFQKLVLGFLDPFKIIELCFTYLLLFKHQTFQKYNQYYSLYTLFSIQDIQSNLELYSLIMNMPNLYRVVHNLQF
ncbi:unnamed protein product [Paramecium sonneborni]|uniref:Transmembrane protein n=1 Tax=Paramecium sonneborni TaxID=65129 RepID=A0A8S1RQK4_9CILI|nr:unnamed protein product [Paramecium sonneborni]